MHTTILIRLFPILAIAFALLGAFAPELFTGMKPAIIPLLGLIMFGMGLTLTPSNFLAVLKRPSVILIGLTLQFALMPFYAWSISWLFSFPAMLLAGMVLVGSSPGGTASNVIAYLARGDVALSITLTSLSTLIAIIATPFLTLFYAGKVVPVDTTGMLLSMVKIVFLPVLLGLVINTVFRDKIEPMKAIFPYISVFAIVIIIGIVVALNAGRLESIGLIVVLAVMLHNIAGLASGFLAGKLLGYDSKTTRTLAIEVGMQNSGLAVALATKYFGATAALPGAVFSIWHNLSGSLLASLVSNRKKGVRRKHRIR